MIKIKNLSEVERKNIMDFNWICGRCGKPSCAPSGKAPTAEIIGETIQVFLCEGCHPKEPDVTGYQQTGTI